MRKLYHLVRVEDDVGDPYAPASLAHEGFVHCSYREALDESARLYFPSEARLRVLEIDAERLAALGIEVRVARTPRGPMPHVHGAIPRAAIVSVEER